MPWQRPPRTNHLEDPEFHWPAWKVDLRIEDLFGDLHERFNTAPMFIQDPNAFHHDVADIADRASNKADFYARLQERRDERLAELLKMMDYLDAFDLRRHFDQLSEFQRARYFLLRRNASLDSLIAFIASFLGPNKSGELPSVDKLLSSESLKKKYGHFLQGVSTTESTISAQTQPHESPGRLPGPASADESELTDRELDDGEQMLGFMKVKRKRKRKRKRLNKVIDETSHGEKRQRPDMCEPDESQDTSKDTGSGSAVLGAADSQTKGIVTRREGAPHQNSSDGPDGPEHSEEASQEHSRALQLPSSQCLPATTSQASSLNRVEGPSESHDSCTAESLAKESLKNVLG